MTSYFCKLPKCFLLLVLILVIPIISEAQVNNNEESEEKQAEVVIFNTLDEEAVERLSKIYGHQIFKSDSSRIFETSSIAKIPDSYTLGQGDELTLSIFGASQYDGKFTIGTEGYIKPEGMPRIFLKGLNWGKAKKLIQSRFQRYYVFLPEQFGLTLSQPRVITVNILGEVERPGSYDLVATNTAFNALIAAGGPSETGSFRNIRVIKDQEQRELDIYEVMDKPGAQFQFYLEDNIIIQVPVAQRIVEVQGAVKRPLKYELKEGEGLLDLIKYTGGLSADAYQEVVQIERFTDNKQILIDINLAELIEQNKDYVLLNGDVIRVKSLAKAIENIVNISGAVELAGNYALESTPRISDLLSKGIITKQARLDVAFLTRRNEDNTSQLIQVNLEDIIENVGASVDMLLKPYDKLMVYAQSRYIDLTNIKVTGAIRGNSMEFPFDPDSTITIRKAILLAGGLKPQAADFGYLIRTNQYNQKEIEYLRVNVKSALDDPDGEDNLVLRPFDELRISTQAAFTDVYNISIKGAVRTPETFQYDESLKLEDLITLAEGFKPEASRKLDIFRLEIKDDQPTKTIIATVEVDKDYKIVGGVPSGFSLMPNDEVIARTVPDYNTQSLVQIEGEVIFPGEYSLLKKNESLTSIIQRAGGLTAEAFIEGLTILRGEETIVTNLNQALKNSRSNYNISLKEGDIIRIPEQEGLVSILLANTGVGDLEEKSTKAIKVAFESNKSAKWYIDEYAAGFGEMADKEKVTVAYANGSTKGTKRWLTLKKYPKPQKGSIISIGTKQELTEEELEKSSQESLYKGYPKLKKGVIITLDRELLDSLDKENRVDKEDKENRVDKEDKENRVDKEDKGNNL